MSKIIDIITNLFNGDKVLVGEDGQKTITLDTILPEVEGLKLIDDENMATHPENSANSTDLIDLANFATSADIVELRDAINDIRNLIEIGDDLANIEDKLNNNNNVEIW